MRRLFLLGLVAAAAVTATARAQGPKFLDRPMGDWIKDLADADPEVRRGAAFALGKIGADGGTAQVVAALTHSLGDPDAAVRDFAASGLGDVLTAPGDGGKTYWKQAAGALQAALKDKEPRVRRSAAYALGAFGADAAPARDDLIAAAGDASPLVRQNAAWALGRLGAAAGADGVSQLRNLLKDDEPLVRRDALHALGQVGNPTAHPAVAAMLKTAGGEKDAVVRKAAVEALARLVGPEDRDDAGELRPLLGDNDSETRYNAAIVLGGIGGREAVAALPALRAALKDPDAHFQELAAAALGGLGPDAAPAVSDLGDVLTSAKDLKTRDNAALALTHVGPAAKGALPQLLKALRYVDSGPDAKFNVIRPHVAEAVADIGYPGVVAALPDVLRYIRNDPDPEVRHFCVYALTGVEDLERYDAVGPLSAVLEEKDEPTKMVRYSAARLLAGRLQEKAPAKTADVLVGMLTDPNLFLYTGTDAKVKGVGSEGTAGASETKQNLGEDARYMGAQALGWMGRKANRPDVIRALEAAAQDKDAKLRDEAKKALQSIKNQ